MYVWDYTFIKNIFANKNGSIILLILKSGINEKCVIKIMEVFVDCKIICWFSVEINFTIEFVKKCRTFLFSKNSLCGNSIKNAVTFVIKNDLKYYFQCCNIVQCYTRSAIPGLSVNNKLIFKSFCNIDVLLYCKNPVLNYINNYYVGLLIWHYFSNFQWWYYK